MKPIVLASQSPRRKALLESVGLSFEVMHADIDETINPDVSIEVAVEQIAIQKAQAVAPKALDAIVIAADTVVVVDGMVLGKPKDVKEAKSMLIRLNGRSHEVISGVAICHNGTVHCFHEKTMVTFYDNDEQLFDAYAQTSSLDKAGAYGIQDFGKVFVASIQGDYYNVVGLPIAKVYQYIMAISKL